jgi:hypothetical protein
VARASIDALIDRFAAEVSVLGEEPGIADNESAGFPLAEPGNPIIRRRETSWVPEMEQRIGHSFPPSFRSLVTRYEYAPFEAGGLMLLGNNDRGELFDLPQAIFRDKAIFEATSKAGLVQFGRPYWYNYDPACFDTRRRTSAGEYPIVQIDHEEILCHDRIKVVGDLFPSFASYAERVVSGQLARGYVEKLRQGGSE